MLFTCKNVLFFGFAPGNGGGGGGAAPPPPPPPPPRPLSLRPGNNRTTHSEKSIKTQCIFC